MAFSLLVSTCTIFRTGQVQHTRGSYGDVRPARGVIMYRSKEQGKTVDTASGRRHNMNGAAEGLLLLLGARHEPQSEQEIGLDVGRQCFRCLSLSSHFPFECWLHG